jgi:hypothetical protein
VKTVGKRSGGDAGSPLDAGVIEWRLDELIAAGYERNDALTLARRVEVDLHLAADLPRRGCPHKTAIRILL